MQRILEFVRNGGDLTDEELTNLIRERMLKIPEKTQRNWLRQLILALHGYGGERHLAAAARVRDAIKVVDPGLT